MGHYSYEYLIPTDAGDPTAQRDAQILAATGTNRTATNGMIRPQGYYYRLSTDRTRLEALAHEFFGEHGPYATPGGALLRMRNRLQKIRDLRAAGYTWAQIRAWLEARRDDDTLTNPVDLP